jgi:hypothetical protein
MPVWVPTCATEVGFHSSNRASVGDDVCISLYRGASMKAVVLHEYGGPGKLRYEEVDDPAAG